MQEGVVRALAAEGADKHEAGRTAFERGSDRQFAVGLVLLGGKHLAGHGGQDAGQVRRHGIEIADPQFRRHAQHRRRAAMPASAAMMREPSTWRSSSGVRMRSPPSRMVNWLMCVALTSPACETEAALVP